MGITRRDFYKAVRHRFGELTENLMVEQGQDLEQVSARAAELLRKELEVAIPKLVKEHDDGKEAK